MKNYTFKLFLIFTGLFVFLTAQNTPAQKKSDFVNLNYILTKLTFTSRISKSAEQINDELIKEIRERKVDFILEKEIEKEIEKAGGNKLLIKTIRKNLREGFKERVSLSKQIHSNKDNKENLALYKKYTDNFRGNCKQKK